MWAAEREIPERFGKNPIELPPSTTINNNFGTVIHNKIDPSTIKPSILKNVLAKKLNETKPQTESQVSSQDDNPKGASEGDKHLGQSTVEYAEIGKE
jgi:hypothetical protein